MNSHLCLEAQDCPQSLIFLFFIFFPIKKVGNREIHFASTGLQYLSVYLRSGADPTLSRWGKDKGKDKRKDKGKDIFSSLSGQNVGRIKADLLSFSCFQLLPREEYPFPISPS